MTLLITVIAAAASTIIWYSNEHRDTYRLGTLSLIYWGASLMWFVDFIFEYSELHSDYFIPETSEIINDSLLGLTVVTAGLIVWLVILLIKDPKGIFNDRLMKNKN